MQYAAQYDYDFRVISEEPVLETGDVNGEVTAADSQFILIYYLENTVAHNPTTWEEILSNANA